MLDYIAKNRRAGFNPKVRSLGASASKKTVQEIKAGMAREFDQKIAELQKTYDTQKPKLDNLSSMQKAQAELRAAKAASIQPQIEEAHEIGKEIAILQNRLDALNKKIRSTQSDIAVMDRDIEKQKSARPAAEAALQDVFQEIQRQVKAKATALASTGAFLLTGVLHELTKDFKAAALGKAQRFANFFYVAAEKKVWVFLPFALEPWQDFSDGIDTPESRLAGNWIYRLLGLFAATWSTTSLVVLDRGTILICGLNNPSLIEHFEKKIPGGGNPNFTIADKTLQVNENSLYHDQLSEDIFLEIRNESIFSRL